MRRSILSLVLVTPMLCRILVAAMTVGLVGCAGPDPQPARPSPEAARSATAAPVAVPAPPSAPLATTTPTASPEVDRPLRDHLSFPAPSDEPRPLIVVLHGYGTSAAIVAQILGAETLAQTHDVHVLLPNGTEDGNGRLAWNATDACCDFDGRGVDDVAAIADLIEDTVARRPVDRDRIYVAGFSNGAFMAHRLACDLSERLAAVVAMSGVGFLDDDRCGAQAPVALLQIHGDADPIVPYEGGHVLGRADLPAHPGSDETAARWADRNACSGHRDERIEFSGRPTSRRLYLGCRAPVERWKVEGGRHVIGTDRASVDRALAFLLSQRRVSASEGSR